MVKIWFTSDSHFGHRNIIKYCKRPFSSAEEMDEVMTDKWNEVVGDRDWVFHLGDFYCGKSRRDAEKIFDSLNGKKFLIKGNHDRKIVTKLPWERIYDTYHLKLRTIPTWQNCKQEVFLSHYSHRVWNKSFHGVGHLWGHSHGGMDFYQKSFDVGVDCHDFYPISWEKVQNYFDVLETLKEMKIDAEKIRHEIKEDSEGELCQWICDLKETEKVDIMSIISKYGEKHES